MWLNTKTGVSRSRLLNIRAGTRQTDRQTHTHIGRHDRTYYHAAFVAENRSNSGK